MRAAAAFAAIAALSLASAAHAEDRSDALDAPAPPTLPALAHRTFSDTFEVTFASIEPTNGNGRALAWFLHDEAEYPLIARKWYLGAAHDVVAGAVPGVGHDFFFGAPELWTRALWSSVIGLSSGGGLGVVLPAPRNLSDDARKIFQAVSVVRPWDAAYFTDRELTLRPWLDVRHVVWRFILQLRQGLDIGVLLRTPGSDEQRTHIVGRTTFYAGFRLARPIGVGIELWEVYQLTGFGSSDSNRAATTLSPSVRLMLGRIEPAFSLLFPIATPLRGEAASYWAARFNVGFDFDAGR